MTYDFITGMSLEYYDIIGKHMIESWLKHWPKECKLKIYAEDNLPILDDRIEVIDLNNIDPKYTEFQNASFKLGRRSKKFAKKAWPIMLNLESNKGRLVWIDADVVTEDTITLEYLDSLLEKDDFSCHLGVPQGKYYSVETGFFIINRYNDFKDQFLKNYQYIYHNRDFSNMHKPFDGDAFGKVIRDLREDCKFKYTELSDNCNSSLSPFNYIFEGKMRHYKAKRKYGIIDQ